MNNKLVMQRGKYVVLPVKVVGLQAEFSCKDDPEFTFDVMEDPTITGVHFMECRIENEVKADILFDTATEAEEERKRLEAEYSKKEATA